MMNQEIRPDFIPAATRNGLSWSSLAITHPS